MTLNYDFKGKVLFHTVVSKVLYFVGSTVLFIFVDTVKLALLKNSRIWQGDLFENYENVNI